MQKISDITLFLLTYIVIPETSRLSVVFVTKDFLTGLIGFDMNVKLMMVISKRTLMISLYFFDEF